MSTTYNADGSAIVAHAGVSVVNPVDGDTLNAASNNAAIETLANEVEHLKTRALLRDELVTAGGDHITGMVSLTGANAKLYVAQNKLESSSSAGAYAGFNSNMWEAPRHYATLNEDNGLGFSTAQQIYRFIPCYEFRSIDDTAHTFVPDANGVYVAPASDLVAKVPVPRGATISSALLYMSTNGTPAGAAPVASLGMLRFPSLAATDPTYSMIASAVSVPIVNDVSPAYYSIPFDGVGPYTADALGFLELRLTTLSGNLRFRHLLLIFTYQNVRESG